MRIGALMSRLSGFCCAQCGAPLRYFAILGTFEGGLGGQSAQSIPCDACGSAMCLVEHRGWWSPFRLVIGILPEVVLVFAVFVILRWVMDATVMSGPEVLAVIVGKAALFLPAVMAVAVLENRANHRVRELGSLYKGREGENEEEMP